MKDNFAFNEIEHKNKMANEELTEKLDTLVHEKYEVEDNSVDGIIKYMRENFGLEPCTEEEWNADGEGDYECILDFEVGSNEK